jgi:exopolyphosphatase / guanosine-5'-triphosphate,3'-diphosphate pyrophosphatase
MKVSVIDVGSSACRLLTAYAHPDGRLLRVDGTREAINLGRRVFERGGIDGASADEALGAIGRALARARQAGAHRIAAVGTSPFREAPNRSLLLTRAWREHGLQFEVLSGREEADLAYRGARSALHPDGGRIAVLKLGNGSVELVAGEGAHPALSFTLPLGALRLRDMMGLDQAPLRPRHVELLRAHVQAVARAATAAIRDLAPARLVLTSGTARGLAALAASLPGATTDDAAITLSGACRVIHVLSHASPKASAALLERSPRLDTIGVGAVVLATLLELLGVTEAEVVDTGFREGVALRELDRARDAASAAAGVLAPLPQLLAGVA